MIVLIAVAEKQVPITDTFNPNPIAGRQSIFNRVSVATETGYSIEIVGAFSNLDMANQSRADHAKDHPGRKYIQKVCKLDDLQAMLPPEPTICVRCRKEIPGPESYCPPCQQQQWRDQANNDPMHATAPDPIIRTTMGQDAMIDNTTGNVTKYVPQLTNG